jgi:hypothetical protein
MSSIKTITINVLVASALLGLLFLAPPITHFVYSTLMGGSLNGPTDQRGGLALYQKFPWAAKHFEEIGELTTQYYDFITWRRNDYTGDTITVVNGLRKTEVHGNISIQTGTYWFFGGSTTWGTGVSDPYTYPSLFSAHQNTNVINYGESGYIARQSLAYLMNNIITNEQENLTDVHVIFYDGVNDTSHYCRRGVNGLGTVRQAQVQNIIYRDLEKYSFKRTFSQLLDFISSVVGKFYGDISEIQYGCAKNNERAIEVATSLVSTWKAASDLVEARGGKFTAILQPVAFIGTADFSYLGLNAANDIALSQQFKEVYPRIIEMAGESDFNFIDLTSAYDGCVDCYIDYNHVGPQAHQMLVKKLSIALNE